MPKGHFKPHSEETKRRLSQIIKEQYKNGRIHWAKDKHLPSPMQGKHHSEQTKQKIIDGQKAFYQKHPEVLERIKTIGKVSKKTEFQRIIEEKEELEKQGFRVIPLCKVIPDLIAIKDNLIFAIEVEYQKPNYNKYTPEFRKFYDDIIWIIKNKRGRF